MEATASISHVDHTGTIVTDNSQGHILNSSGHGKIAISYGPHTTVKNTAVYNGPGPLQSLIRSHNAEYNLVDKVQRRPCTVNTRQSILKEVIAWCHSTSAMMMYWICGMAGTGKTTIAYTICQLLQELGMLGASFFCSRSLSDCRDVRLIFPTIAYQLSRLSNTLGAAICAAMQDDADIHRRPLEVQLHKLILEPWENNQSQLPKNAVVVLDGLDECDDDHSPFLRILVNYAPRLPFRIILTSRPEPSIRGTMGTKDSVEVTTTFILHQVEKVVVKEDIARYLSEQLSPISPSVEVVDNLAERSVPLFVYAATLARFIMGNKHGNARQRLELLIEMLPSLTQPNLVTPLDSLYTEILRRVLDSDLTPLELANIKTILYTVICAHEPMNKEAIASLWNMDVHDVEESLKPLRSIVYVPEDDTKPISTFHVSCLDFFLDKSRSIDLWCDADAFHPTLALMCLKTMNRLLRQSICELDYRCENTSIKPEIVQSHISPALSYACIYGIMHLQKVSRKEIRGSIDMELRTLVSVHGLHWIECLSILDHLDASIRYLGMLGMLFAKDKAMNTLCYQLDRLVQSNYAIINAACGHLYYSAVVWAPKSSLIRIQFKDTGDQPQLPEVLRGLPADWEAPWTAATYSDEILSVALSPNGSQVISGSSDSTISVWSVYSQEDRYTSNFKGHSGGVQAVAISPDGTWIVSGSTDRTLRVWSLVNRQVTLTIRGHSDSVQSVAVSPDGRQICSGSKDRTVRLWGSLNGKLLHLLEGHQGCVESVVFTFDGKFVVSGSEDSTVRVWSVKSGKMTKELTSPPILPPDPSLNPPPKATNDNVDTSCHILCVAASPKDNTIIAGSADKNIRVWRWREDRTKIVMKILPGHWDAVLAVAFFHDGVRAASSSKDWTIRIWNISNHSMLKILPGHKDWVSCIAVFPDDLRIVSGSHNHTLAIRMVPRSLKFGQYLRVLWKGMGRIRAPQDLQDRLERGIIMATSSRSIVLQRENAIYLLNPATFSKTAHIPIGNTSHIAVAQGMHMAVAAASRPYSIRLWINATGSPWMLGEHEARINSLEFSNDDLLIISTSEDHTVRIWSIMTKKQIRVILIKKPLYAAFSHDNARITITYPSGIQVWDASTGRKLQTLSMSTLGTATQIRSAFLGDRYIIATYAKSIGGQGIAIWDMDSGAPSDPIRVYDDYLLTVTSSKGVAYAYCSKGILHCVVDPTQFPKPVCVIPSQNQPARPSLEVFSCPEWDLVCLDDRRVGANSVILRIPRI